MLSHCAFIASDKWRSGSLCWVLYVFYPPFLWYLHPLYSSFLFPLFEANCSWKPWFDVPCVSDFFIFFFFLCGFVSCFVWYIYCEQLNIKISSDQLIMYTHPIGTLRIVNFAFISLCMVFVIFNLFPISHLTL